MVTQAFANDDSVERAKEIVAYYTLAASVTGAVPVPAASVAVVAETGAMLSQLASHFGQEISVGTVVESVGFVGSLNVVGRSLFVEIGKALSWGTGQPWAAFALSAAGAATAGLQTYIIGLLAIETGKKGGGRFRQALALG